MLARRLIAACVVGLVVAVAAATPAGAARGDETGGGGSGGSVGDDGLTGIVDEEDGGGGGGSGGGPVCSSWFLTNGEVASIVTTLPVDGDGAADQLARYVDAAGKVWQVQATSCDPGGTSVRLVEVVDGALVTAEALSRVPWPAFELGSIPSTRAVSLHEVALGLEGDDWAPISASASDAGMTVTVTAVPREVRWFTGGINSLITGDSGDDYVTCVGLGLDAMNADDTSCTFEWLSTSAGFTDDLGEADRVTLQASLIWDITYTSNIPTAVAGPATFTVDYQRHGFPVAEVQTVGVGSG